MITNNPAITIDDFLLMCGNSSIHYAENAITRKRTGKNILSFGNYGSKVLSENTTAITNNLGGNDMSVARAIESVSFGDSRYIFFIDENINLWISSASSTTGQKLFNGNESSIYPSIKSTGSSVRDKILFSYDNYVGAIHRGRATGGSATTLVDTGSDFTAGEYKAENGHGGLAAADKVYNVTQNKLYTINSAGIAATTLTITAVDGGSGFSANDYYVIVNPDWAALSNDESTYGRQICEHRGYFFIPNGSYLAMYDGTTYTANYKLLENNWIGRCITSSGGMVAVGANSNYKGKIFFWSNGLDGWKNILSLDDEIQAIIPYAENFIFVSGNSLWFTDGYTKTKIDSFPDVAARDNITIYPNAILSVDNFIVTINLPSGLLRNRSGIYVYDMTNKHFSFSPFDIDTGIKAQYGTYGYTLHFDSSSNYIYYSAATSAGTTNTIIGRFSLDSNLNNGCIFTVPIKLGAGESISKIEVNLNSGLRNSAIYETFNISLDCRLNDCKRPLWGNAQIYLDSTDEKIITIRSNSGDAIPEAGDEVLFNDGLNSMQRRTISSLTSEDVGGGITEYVITLDSDLPNLSKQGERITVMPFQRYGMEAKNISSYDDITIQDFTPSFTADNFMLELVATYTGNPPAIEIESIKVYI